MNPVKTGFFQKMKVTFLYEVFLINSGPLALLIAFNCSFQEAVVGSEILASQVPFNNVH